MFSVTLLLSRNKQLTALLKKKKKKREKKKSKLNKKRNLYLINCHSAMASYIFIWQENTKV